MQNYQAQGAPPSDPQNSPPLQIPGYAPGQNHVVIVVLHFAVLQCFEMKCEHKI